jgi:hypothetical protein
LQSAAFELRCLLEQQLSQRWSHWQPYCCCLEQQLLSDWEGAHQEQARPVPG